MTKVSTPSFTAIIPVRNGGSYLKECVESILEQTYGNFEIVILDNASNDDSVDYIRKVGEEHENVRVIRSEKYLSIEENWARILDVPKREFLTILGHDDLLHPDFFKTVSELINDCPEGRLYSTHFNLIDSNSNIIRSCKPIPRFEQSHEYLASRLNGIRDSFGTGFVMHSEDYERVGGIPTYPNLFYADDALWIKLINNGLKITSSNICFSYRLHEASTSGKPNKVLLFNALVDYLNFLHYEAKTNVLIAQIIKRYSDPYIIARCKEYFYSLNPKLSTYLSETNKIKSVLVTNLCSEKIEAWEAQRNSLKALIKHIIKRLIKLA